MQLVHDFLDYYRKTCKVVAHRLRNGTTYEEPHMLVMMSNPPKDNSQPRTESHTDEANRTRSTPIAHESAQQHASSEEGNSSSHTNPPQTHAQPHAPQVQHRSTQIDRTDLSVDPHLTSHLYHSLKGLSRPNLKSNLRKFSRD